MAPGDREVASVRRRVEELEGELEVARARIARSEEERKRHARDLEWFNGELASRGEQLAQAEKELGEARRQLAAGGAELSELRARLKRARYHQRRWARDARRLARSRTWRLGQLIAAALRLLTFRRPAPPGGLADLAASIEQEVKAAEVRPGLGDGREQLMGEPPRPVPYEVRQPERPRRRRPVILHVIANFYIGGSAQLVVDLIERLGGQFEQKVVARDLPATPAYGNLELHHYPTMTVELADECLRRFNPDLIHVHFLGHHGNPYSEQDWRWYDALFRAAGSRRPIIENLNIPVDPYVAPAVSAYVYVSDYVRTTFGDGVGNGFTIYPGSDLGHFSRRNPAVEDSDPHVIGMAYRLEADKLNGASIEPFIAVTEHRPKTKALIVGDGTLLESYRGRVDSAGMTKSFRFTGYVAYRDLPAYIGRMSVFVAPVHRESFGQVSVFAMGLELPVVGFDVGALAEILGSRDLLVPFGDSAALSQLIIDLLDDHGRRRALGRANRERALARFSVEGMVGQYERLYRQVLT